MEKELKEALEDIKIPFDLLSAFQSVIAEFGKNKFLYESFSNEGEQTLRFTKPEKRILLAIQKEHLYIRQFDTDKEKRKLRVLYVVKPSERNFKLR